MAKHGLTRVEFRGDQAIIVAGPIPDEIAVKGLTQEVTATPVDTPMTPVRHLEKTTPAPAKKFVAPAKPQAEVKENTSGK